MVKGKIFRSSSGKANKPKKWRNYREISWFQCQCSCSSQIPSQDDANYHQFLSLYKITKNNVRTELHIYNTENETEEVKILDTDIILYDSTSITQLPNGELFCYSNCNSGTTLIIDRNYKIRMLPSGYFCSFSSALYFDNNIYCFGGWYLSQSVALCRKFDLKKNRWISLSSLPETDNSCHSVIFNGNILVSGYCSNNLWLYSIEIDSFSTIPYVFKRYKIKFLINVERLYLIEWDDNGFIYEGEDEYHWKPISKSGKLYHNDQIYCLYNKEKIYISGRQANYYQFDLKKKVIRVLK